MIYIVASGVALYIVLSFAIEIYSPVMRNRRDVAIRKRYNRARTSNDA